MAELTCRQCGVPIFGGPGGWHDSDGRERCPMDPDPFHEPEETHCFEKSTE